MVHKLKTLDEKVLEFIMPNGKYKDEKLDDVPIEYLDWVVTGDNKYTTAWTKKIVNRYIHLRAVQISEKIAEDELEKDIAVERATQDQDDMLGWVDENF